MRLWTPIIRAKFPSIHYTFMGDEIEGRLFQAYDNNPILQKSHRTEKFAVRVLKALSFNRFKFSRGYFQWSTAVPF